MKKDIIIKLENFRMAYEELMSEWMENDEINLNETKSINLYPFHKSFDELGISEWIKSTVNELKQKGS